MAFVYITCKDKKEARKISRFLLEKKLIACANIFPIESMYRWEGKMVDDEIDTFGGYGVAQVPNLQALLQHICRNGYEHHVAMNLSSCAGILYEAFTTYLDINVYYHK